MSSLLMIGPTTLRYAYQWMMSELPNGALPSKYDGVKVTWLTVLSAFQVIMCEAHSRCLVGSRQPLPQPPPRSTRPTVHQGKDVSENAKRLSGGKIVVTIDLPGGRWASGSKNTLRFSLASSRGRWGLKSRWSGRYPSSIFSSGFLEVRGRLICVPSTGAGKTRTPGREATGRDAKTIF